MATDTRTDTARFFVRNREELARLAEEIDARAGIVGEPEWTPEELQRRMLARGIRPEDNILSSEIIRMRYGDDEE
jgi:hypothetical protein